MGTHAVCWNAMMREAGTIVRGIAADRVFPRMKDHDVCSPPLPLNSCDSRSFKDLCPAGSFPHARCA